MKIKTSKKIMSGFAVLGLLLCGNTQAQIALQDGTTNSTAAVGSGVATISEPFTVTSGAGVMVVELFDFNNNPSDPGPSFVWSNSTLGTSQALSLCESTNTTGYGWTWADLYYVYDPSAGTGEISGTETNSTLNFMFMEAYTLSGVDTTVAPVALGNGNGGATALAVDTPNNTASGSWVAAMSVNYNGGGGNNVTITGDSGGAAEVNFRPDGLQCTMGYLTNLSAGDTTVTAQATGSPTDMDLAGIVFSPLAGTPAPTKVTATSQTNKIAVSWTDASGGAATSYIVLRSTAARSGFASIATNSGNASTTYVDASVTDWITYYYMVQAKGPGGLSLDSASASAYAVGLPAVPAGVTATAGVNQAALTWNNQDGVTTFNITRSTTGGSGFTPVGTSTTNSFTDTSVTDGTLYYYKVDAENSFGTTVSSSQVSAVPVVAFLTNWFGVFNSSADTAPWLTINGDADEQFYAPGPGYGPSSGCLVMDATFGPGSTNTFAGIGDEFTPAINVSTYPSLEMDIDNLGAYDEYGQIQAIQLALQFPVDGAPTYERGTWGDIVLFETQTGSDWTHYVIPMTNWSGFDLTAFSSLGINVYDGNTITATELDPAFANLEFTGAPAWAPVFSGLTSRTIGTNTSSVTLTGTVSAAVAGADVYLASNTIVTVTIDGDAQQTTIGDATGDFSIAFPTTGLPVATYPVTYAAASDMVALIGVTNTATTLTVSTVALPQSPTILPVSLDATGTNVEVKVATVSGHTYYLLSTTNLTPPVVWTTNSTTVGTGGVITNLAPVIKSKPALFLRYLVQ